MSEANRQCGNEPDSKHKAKTQSKCTPGPWKIVSDAPLAVYPRYFIRADDDAGSPVAFLWEDGGSKGKPTQIANALLMAAAPEMYAACAEFIRKVECGEDLIPRSYAQMKQAVAKAERGQS